ncbi:hypothetical protein MH216_21490 [Paenibacillus larvae]|uniref:Uncharacterized protein n=2 Tax=Paenibacillus larvae TaxID=1464 RepID=A0A6C0QRI3_9BACL|nr:hypothetical protein [Paenibacillus larvae]MBH0341395.1 hypothetical protein [Paenibacillus larvae]MCY7522336.1 hypothetical protein [Paenibacillus larvae]MCY9525473.1 hypothetical protein [Paenibacillus larvae]MCY9681423.1 hypothetical protein [Paenibacillus larvae]MCY9751813.1 hypothetical protein [Paenibacillus larvae]
MKKVVASVAMAGMLLGGGATGMVHASTPDQAQEMAAAQSVVGPQLIVEDDFASEISSVFQKLTHGTSIDLFELALRNGGTVVSKDIKLEVGKSYRVTLKNVRGDVLLDVNQGHGRHDLRYWADYGNLGKDISHVFVAKSDTAFFGIKGLPDASMKGFILEKID